MLGVLEQALINEIKNSEIDETKRYKLFETKNIWTFIQLDTVTGFMWQIQYDVQGNNRGGYDLNKINLSFGEEKVNGRFTLYETQNMYNFILLDQISGKSWQVQWSIDDDKRMVIPLFH